MIDFEPTDEQRLIRETARDFAENELRPRARDRDRDGTFPTAELRALAGLGLLGANVPEALGGAEAGVVAYALAIMELGGGCAATTVAVTVTNMVAEIVVQYGTEAQRREHVPRICSGEYLAGAFALSEPQAGSDAAALRATAEKVPGGWVLRGEKLWITSGDRAGLVIAWARTEPGRGPKGISAFLVRGGTPGLSVGKHEDKMGLRGSSTVPLIFDDCRVGDEALLGTPGDGFRIAMTALDGGRIGVAALAVGIGTAAQRAAVSYARERQAFGGPLANLQAIQWMLADSEMELAAARLLVLRAAWLKEHARPFSCEASMAKVFATEGANRACDRALQIHGAYGYVRECEVERHLRDVRVTRIFEGTSEIQRLVIARAVLKDFGIV
jgi:alkylation response protein AidB-like acyl-CoA dehydrogenase